jgi:hypothetical protein
MPRKTFTKKGEVDYKKELGPRGYEQNEIIKGW